jgi:hypothetical protein
VQYRTGGASPFGNMGVQYKGSTDDAALNAAVLRYRADPAAVTRFAADTDLAGRIVVPVLTVKGVDDPTALVELDAYFKTTMERGGSAAQLVQTFTKHDTHSYLSDPTYPTLMKALLRWVDEGAKPTPEQIARQCAGMEAEFGKGCAFLPDYVPAALSTRVADRDRPWFPPGSSTASSARHKKGPDKRGLIYRAGFVAYAATAFNALFSVALGRITASSLATSGKK